MFCEKLDFLMRLTDTQNSKMGRAIHLDAAHISRLRSGRRALPKRPMFIRPMCDYLSKRVIAEYQKSALCNALKLSEWPSGQDSTNVLEKWLTQEMLPSADVGTILESLIRPVPKEESSNTQPEVLPKSKCYYYGIDGKREAVLQFFDLVQKEKEPQTLLLSSEEDMEWMYADAAFAAR